MVTIKELDRKLKAEQTKIAKESKLATLKQKKRELRIKLLKLRARKFTAFAKGVRKGAGKISKIATRFQKRKSKTDKIFFGDLSF